jgi:general secretion pathway protein D
MNSRARIPLAIRIVPSRAVAAVLLALGMFAGTQLHAASGRSLYKSGQNAEARQDFDAAYDFYQKAAARDPKDVSIRAAVYRMRTTDSTLHVSKGRKLAQAGDDQGALSEFLHAAEVDPSDQAAQQEIAKLRAKANPNTPHPEAMMPEAPGIQQELDSVAGPIALHPLSNEPLSFKMTEDAKVIYQAIGKAAGVNVLFDPDYTSRRITVELNNVSLMDALRIVGTMSGTFWKPVTANTLFVAQDNQTKRRQLDEQAVQTFYLSNAWQNNDVNDVQQALRNVLTDAKIYGVASQNAIVIRATPDELLLAQQLINDLDKARAEVVVDIAVLEVSKNWERNLGVAWPNSFGVTLTPPCTTSSSTTCTSSSGSSTTTTTPTLYNLAHLKSTDFNVTVGSATLNLLLSDDNTKILQSPRIRATDSQKATMKIGSKIPIATGSYQTGAATAVVSSLVNTQFQYQDVGVNIEMTPTVHFDNDVTLKIKIEVTSQSGSVTISGVTEPILSQRVVDQIIRLREGEASILGGIENNQEQQNWTGVPGLSSIPIIKYVFGSKDHLVQNDDIVFVVVPHIVRAQDLDQNNLRQIDTGSGTAIDLRRVDNTNAAPAAAVSKPVAMTQPATGVVPGASAAGAAPALMAQMTASAQNAGNAAAMAQAPAAAAPAAASPATAAGGASFVLGAPSAPQAAGSSFQVPVVLNWATDVASVPLQLTYDPAKLALVNVAAGDLLSRDGQSVALIHRDDGPGNVTVVAARPPGAAGISGSGVVCVLTFQAKAAGTSSISMTRAGAVDSKQQPVQAQPAQATVVVK